MRQRILQPIRNNWINILVMTALALIAFWSGQLSVMANYNLDTNWLSDFSQNFSTEMMGAFVTFILFELVVEARHRHDAEANEKRKARLHFNVSRGF